MRDLLRENDWLVKIDLKGVYFMVPIQELDRKYLRFSVWGNCYQDPEASDGNA